ncbi:hypothetical protein OEZ86_013074 [Tetradesmus obliquus]|nr:hypothetical protein OEZ86_013074 [Tetradesmus obliquus]
MINYHCKNGYDYGSPDYVDILPPSCSGLCLAAVINLCFMVLTYLQPQSPARAVVPRGRGGRSAAQPQQTLNNPNGFVWGPYGGRQHVPAEPQQQQPAAAAPAHPAEPQQQQPAAAPAPPAQPEAPVEPQEVSLYLPYQAPLELADSEKFQDKGCSVFELAFFGERTYDGCYVDAHALMYVPWRRVLTYKGTLRALFTSRKNAVADYYCSWATKILFTHSGSMLSCSGYF